MGTNWANNLDMLAQNGVLDFDAPAYVTGQKPRYVGAPAMPPSPFAGPVPQAPNLNQPKTDEFCLLYTSPSPRDPKTSRMPSSA